MGDVEGRRRHARAGHRGTHGRGGPREFRLIAAIEHDGRARLGEPAGQGEADALTGAGDERGAPGEVEEGIHFFHEFWG